MSQLDRWEAVGLLPRQIVRGQESSNHLKTQVLSETRERQSPDWRDAHRQSGDWRSRAASGAVQAACSARGCLQRSLTSMPTGALMISRDLNSVYPASDVICTYSFFCRRTLEQQVLERKFSHPGFPRLIWSPSTRRLRVAGYLQRRMFNSSNARPTELFIQMVVKIASLLSSRWFLAKRFGELGAQVSSALPRWAGFARRNS